MFYHFLIWLICTMAPVVLLFAVYVLCSWETQGSAAVTPVFVKKGDDVLLKVNEHVELNEETDFFWKFNKLYSIVKLSHTGKPVTFRNYSGRVEFSDQNRSLRLKNLQHADSGYYAAQVTAAKDRIIAEYKVTVRDPVSPVNLSVYPVSNRVDSCNLTVSCSTHNIHINSTFRCDTQTCYQEGGDQSEVSTSGSSLRVYLLNDSIICNHGNQVSWEKDFKGIRDFCPLNAVSELGLKTAIGIGIGISLFCLCMCFGLFKGITTYQQKRKMTCDITTYAVPQDINLAQRPNQNATEGASGLSPNSTYALVGFPNGPTESTENENTTHPETTYAQVSKAPKSNNHPKNTTLPETIYAQVKKKPKSDHHPETENNVYSQDVITVSHDVF